MSIYSKEQFEAVRKNLIMQFGEIDGERLYQLQKQIMEIADSGVNDENLPILMEAQKNYENLFNEIQTKLAQEQSEKEYQEAEEEEERRKRGFIDEDGNSGFESFDDDDDDDDDDEPELTEYEKMLNAYSMAFGAANGAKLAGYMSRISEINNNEGLNDTNRAEYEEIMAKYQELFNSLGGLPKLIQGTQQSTSVDYSEYEDDEDDEDYDEENDKEDDETIGFDAINRAVEELYGDREGVCYGTKIPYSLGGKDPLDIIKIIESNSGGIPHWHYITYGLTELYGKETDDDEVSGYGFELTFRLKKTEEEPPIWPISLMQNLARYVFNTGNTFAAGHHMDAKGPIKLGYDTDITSLIFINDPEFKTIECENGKFEFIQIVGVTKDEMEAAMCWNCQKLMKVFEEFMPFGITDIDRKSFMCNEKVKSAVENGIKNDGSSVSHIYCNMSLGITESGNTKIIGKDIDKNYIDLIKHDGYTLFMGAGNINYIIMMLRARILKGRYFNIQSNDVIFEFKIADKCSVSVDNNIVYIALTEKAFDEMSKKLQPKTGIYSLDSNKMDIVVTITEIKNPDGEVVESIG